MFCEKCGEKMPDGATTCEKCGYSLTSAPTPAAPGRDDTTSVVYDTPQEAPKKENIPMGIIGALLGALVGGACIVALYMAGYVASLSGFVLAFATCKGYELLGKRLGKAGVTVCILLMLIVPYLSIRLAYAITVANELGWDYMSTFAEIESLISMVDMSSEYLSELGMTYLFTALGAIFPLRNLLSRR